MQISGGGHLVPPVTVSPPSPNINSSNNSNNNNHTAPGVGRPPLSPATSAFTATVPGTGGGATTPTITTTTGGARDTVGVGGGGGGGAPPSTLLSPNHSPTSPPTPTTPPLQWAVDDNRSGSPDMPNIDDASHPGVGLTSGAGEQRSRTLATPPVLSSEQLFRAAHWESSIVPPGSASYPSIMVPPFVPSVEFEGKSFSTDEDLHSVPQSIAEIYELSNKNRKKNKEKKKMKEDRQFDYDEEENEEDSEDQKTPTLPPTDEDGKPIIKEDKIEFMRRIGWLRETALPPPQTSPLYKPMGFFPPGTPPPHFGAPPPPGLPHQGPYATYQPLLQQPQIPYHYQQYQADGITPFRKTPHKPPPLPPPHIPMVVPPFPPYGTFDYPPPMPYFYPQGYRVPYIPNQPARSVPVVPLCGNGLVQAQSPPLPPQPTTNGRGGYVGSPPSPHSFSVGSPPRYKRGGY
ncbi:hypothetical protein Pelo_7194 [Pelomyxa schiedti]|nr:hypothetical protein Pelo_7194 [Pelomyxa schiedti]